MVFKRFQYYNNATFSTVLKRHNGNRHSKASKTEEIKLPNQVIALLFKTIIQRRIIGEMVWSVEKKGNDFFFLIDVQIKFTQRFQDSIFYGFEQCTRCTLPHFLTLCAKYFKGILSPWSSLPLEVAFSAFWQWS